MLTKVHASSLPRTSSNVFGGGWVKAILVFIFVQNQSLALELELGPSWTKDGHLLYVCFKCYNAGTGKFFPWEQFSSNWYRIFLIWEYWQRLMVGNINGWKRERGLEYYSVLVWQNGSCFTNTPYNPSCTAGLNEAIILWLL